MPGERYPSVLRIPILWGDEDSFGHVNNTVYVRWCETGRVEYMRRAGMWVEAPPTGVGPILASVTCDYKQPLKYPGTVDVCTRVTRIGTSSIRFEQAIVNVADGSVAALSHSIIVTFDYAAGKPAPVSAEVRRAIEAIEGAV
jgi:acyl-CoA thioester hydrolase